MKFEFIGNIIRKKGQKRESEGLRACLLAFQIAKRNTSVTPVPCGIGHVRKDNFSARKGTRYTLLQYTEKITRHLITKTFKGKRLSATTAVFEEYHLGLSVQAMDKNVRLLQDWHVFSVFQSEELSVNIVRYE